MKLSSDFIENQAEGQKNPNLDSSLFFMEEYLREFREHFLWTFILQGLCSLSLETEEQ